MKRFALAVAMAAALGASGSNAQEVVGDWVGPVKTPGAELTITLHVEKGPDGALRGVAGSPDQTPMPLPVSDMVFQGDTLTFSIPQVAGSFKAKWDPAARAWVGALTQGGFEMPISLAHGKPAPLPTIAGLDGDWQGVLQVPQGDLRIVLRVKTDAAGTRAMFSSPDQSPGEIAAALTRDGDTVGFQLKGLGGFDGKLSPDGKTIDGHWRQFGNALPLTMKKGG